MTDQDYFKREQKFKVLYRSMSVISDYYDTTNEDKEAVLRMIAQYINKMYHVTFVFQRQSFDLAGAIRSVSAATGTKQWCINLIDNTKKTFINELKQISEKHNDKFVKDILNELAPASNAEQPTQQSKNPANNAPKKQGGCYVATCVYGSYDCPEVWTLRRYRDDTLGSTWYGRAFIKTYYAISPTLVKWFGETKWFKKMWRGKLDRMVKKLQNKGIESTPYQDKNW